MKRKDLKGKVCVYCNDYLAKTWDHVIARKFFPVQMRGNLPQAPACIQCNCLKSDLEQYAMTVFPFGSEHHAAQEMLTEEVRNRLDENHRLHRELREGMDKVRILNSGEENKSTISLPIDEDKITTLFEMIIKGLIWHHFKVFLPSTHILRVYSFTEYGLDLFEETILSLSQEMLEKHSLAEGGFNYTFTRNRNDPTITAWVLSFYELVHICGVTDEGELLQVYTCGLTGPSELVNVFDKFLDKDAA